MHYLGMIVVLISSLINMVDRSGKLKPCESLTSGYVAQTDLSFVSVVYPDQLTSESRYIPSQDIYHGGSSTYLN